MAYRLINSNDETISISEQAGFDIKYSKWQPQIYSAERIGSPGLNISGDRNPKKRSEVYAIDLAMETRDRTQNEIDNNITLFNFDTWVNDLIKFFDGGDIYVEDTDADKRAKVELTGLTPKQMGKGSGKNANTVTISLIFTEGSWESTTATTGTTTTAAETSVTITNSGSLLSYPIWTISAPSGSTATQFSIENDTNGRSIFVELNITSGDDLILNSVTGAVTYNGVDVSNSVSAGGHVLLSPGDNEITFTDLNGNVKFDHSFNARFAY